MHCACGRVFDEPVCDIARVAHAIAGKDPSVSTDFLPDKDRELEEEQVREQLKKEWQLRQQVLKNEPLQITYSYWDGSGHRRKLIARKGDTIADFLKAVRDQLSPGGCLAGLGNAA